MMLRKQTKHIEALSKTAEQMTAQNKAKKAKKTHD